jgi:hypothetical protein
VLGTTEVEYSGCVLRIVSPGPVHSNPPALHRDVDVPELSGNGVDDR